MTASLLRDTFEGIPVDILLEVAKYLEATDMLSLRASSRYLKNFASTHNLWLDAARSLGYRRSLPLPPGRRVNNATTSQLIQATFRANKLQQELCTYKSDEIVPTGRVRTFRIPSLNPLDIKMNLVEGGKYIITAVDDVIVCWSLISGKPLATMTIQENPQLYLSTVILEDDGAEVIILAVHLTVIGPFLDGVIPHGGRIAIFKLRLPSQPEAFSVPSFTEVFSKNLFQSVPAIIIDDGIVAIAGQDYLWSALQVVAIDLKTLNYAVMQSQVKFTEENMSLEIFSSHSEVAVYYETDDASHVISYDRKALLDVVNKPPVEKGTILVLPKHTRISQFNEASKLYTAGFWNSCISPDLINASRAGWKSLPVRTSRTQEEDDVTTVACHVLDHIFEDTESTEEKRDRQTYSVRDEDVMWDDENGCTMMWLAPGYIMYIAKSDEGELSLRLVSFPIREASVESPVEKKIVLPWYIALERVETVDFDHTWGAVILVMTDSTLHYINLV